MTEPKEISDPGRRVSRRALMASVGASSAGLLALAVVGCQSSPPATTAAAAPTAAPAAKPTEPTATAATTKATERPKQPGPPPSTPTPAPAVPSATTASTPTPASAPQPAAAATSPAKVSGVADLAVVKGANPIDITRAAVEAIGGIGRFVSKGSTVVVKPNICNAIGPEYAVNTNPEVVGALVALCKEAGASKVKVLDYGWGGQRTAYSASGIEAAVQKAGGEMVPITPIKWKATPLPKAKVLRTQEVYEDVLSADVLINVPIAKDHGLSRLTLAMKNLMGTVRYREPYHGALGQSLSDLATVVKPTFTLLDAVRILTRNGPGGGSLDYVKRLDTVVASTDMVAIDAYSASFFDVKPDSLETVRTGQANGLGTSDLSKLKIAEVKRG